MTRDEILAAVKAGKSLANADLEGANLEGAYLREAYLQGADLRGADLTEVDLREAVLRGADLREADLQGADLTGTRLRGAYLLGDSQWGQAKFTDDQLRRADWDISMIFNPTNTKELLVKRTPFICFPTFKNLTAFDYPAREADPENPGLTPCLSSRYAVYSQGVLIVVFDKMDDIERVYVLDAPNPETQATIAQVLQDSGYTEAPIPLSEDNMDVVLKSGSAGLAVLGS